VSRAAAAVCVALAGCSYLLPASWRSFRVEPDDAAPAITRAVDSFGASVESFHQAKRQIVTHWATGASGALRTRERFLINWERDAQEQSLTVYVRHEIQEQEIVEGGAVKWGATYHDSDREAKMLDRIAAELKH
jgi:hypothetical protein